MPQRISWRKGIPLIFLAWLAMIGFDLFWHAGVAAGLYAQPDPFLLAPERAFALIPIGYLSFLLLAVLLVWLAARVGVDTARAGATFGLKLGGQLQRQPCFAHAPRPGEGQEADAAIGQQTAGLFQLLLATDERRPGLPQPRSGWRFVRFLHGPRSGKLCPASCCRWHKRLVEDM
jgi:hypothetical protein